MPDYVQTPANVRVFGSTTVEYVTGGVDVQRGQPVYKDAAGLYQLAKSDTQEHAAVAGFAFTPTSGSNKKFMLVKAGVVGLGITFDVGVPVIVSSVAGALCPIDDAASGWWITIVGIPLDADQMDIKIVQSPAAKA